MYERRPEYVAMVPGSASVPAAEEARNPNGMRILRRGTDGAVRLQDRLMIGVRLQTLLGQRGWTQAHIAGVAGFKPSYISHVIAGTRTPSVTNLVRLADALGVSVDALLGRVEPSSVVDCLPLATNAELMAELSLRMFVSAKGES